MFVLRVLVGAMGVLVVFGAISSAIRLLVLPRHAFDRIGGSVFVVMRQIFALRVRRVHSYAQREAAMAFYAPVSILMLLVVWLLLVMMGYALLDWGLMGGTFADAVVYSGSSLFTLGFAVPAPFVPKLVLFSEAMMGMILVALLISYLPTIYAAFSRRELAITLLDVRAGNPPTAAELLLRASRLGNLDHLSDFWETWETWFADIAESHTSFAALAFFRSPNPDQSWVTAAGTVLDAAALSMALLNEQDTGHHGNVHAAMCVRSGYVALRRIAAIYGQRFSVATQATDPISVSRDEFDAVCDRLASEGVPISPDRDHAWQVYAGWRVNYDAVVITLAAITVAPYAPWISDRSLRVTSPHIRLAERLWK